MRGQIYMGSDAFVERMQATLKGKNLTEVPKAQRRPLAKQLAYYRDNISDADRHGERSEGG